MATDNSNEDARPHAHRMAARRTTVAAISYLVLCVYLYYPYLPKMKPDQYLVMVNSVVAAMGCFALSKRWISVNIASIFAGAVYGFSPLAFGFAHYHPVAGLPLAVMPWLFCPAAFWRKLPGHEKLTLQRGKSSPATVITAGLCILPFLIILLFFRLSASPGLFPIFPVPVQQKLTLASLAGMAAPLTLQPHNFIFSFYHVPLLTALMGLCMYLVLSKPGVIVMVGVAIVLAFSKPILQTSPIVWALIPMLFGSILVGLGMEGFAFAGAADCRWILFCLAAVAVVAAGCGILSLTDGRAYRQAFVMHSLSVVLAGIIYFMARAKIRLHLLRWTVLATALGLDIILSARYMLMRIF